MTFLKKIIQNKIKLFKLKNKVNKIRKNLKNYQKGD